MVVPRPWTTELIEFDLHPGGRCAMIMRGPNEEQHRIESVVLEVVPGRRVVATDAYRVGWVPQTPFITNFFELAPDGAKTRYTGRARHWSAEARQQHEAMGFADGWGKVAEQLEEVARRLV